MNYLHCCPEEVGQLAAEETAEILQLAIDRTRLTLASVLPDDSPDLETAVREGESRLVALRNQQVQLLKTACGTCSRNQTCPAKMV